VSVRPVAFGADGSVEVVCDETGHGGWLPPAQVRWGVDRNGAPDPSQIVLECPDGCGVASFHPVGGGAAPPLVQEMFMRKIEHEGCPCGQIGGACAEGLAYAHAKLACERQDGAGRWQVPA
jgi:hypothetical protein